MTKVIELRRRPFAALAGVIPENDAFCRARCEMLRHWRAWAATGLSAADAGAEIELNTGGAAPAFRTGADRMTDPVECLPDPLTPPDCDLRDFGFMPVDVVRLRDSHAAALPDAEAFRACVLS